MKQSLKKTLALLLAVVQMLVLFPIGMHQARAADNTVPANAKALNPVIEGTVRFGSFNYTGDSKGNRDGVDYVTTFYYTDDYFAASAENPKAIGSKEMQWSDLENQSLVTLSKDFTIACYGSSEDTVPVDWDHKDKNGIAFLENCEFDAYDSNNEYNAQTTADSIGAIYGTKVINVWNPDTEQNERVTLIAVGVRGAGYGAEWASNFTIGNPNDPPSLNDSGNYRHHGFEASANKVMDGLDAFLQDHPITTEKAKYWVVGYSRAGAVANLVAGKLSDDNYSGKYKTDNRDVYGYTFEAAAGALKTDDEFGTNYKNIHNILSKMDVVPLLSPDLFNHCRLGVDYYLPYYGNAGDNNETYYKNMYEVLKNVAVLAPNYRDENTTRDPVLDDADPASYPYNDSIQLSNFGITNPLPEISVLGFSIGGQDGFTKKVNNSESVLLKRLGVNSLMLDQFLRHLIVDMMSSRAWDAKDLRRTTGFFGGHTYYNDNMTFDPFRHEWHYVSPAADTMGFQPNTSYQSAIRVVAELALKNPAVGLGTLSSIMDNIGTTDILTNGLSAFDLGQNYLRMDWAKYNSTNYNEQVFEMQNPLSTILNNVLGKTGLFITEADLDAAKQAMNVLVPPLTWLYCEDHHKNDGEYLGTLMDNLGTILSAHVPEEGVSWAMSLDDVFTSDYREITVPKVTAIRMYEFRNGIDDAFTKNTEGVAANADAEGALVAQITNGAFIELKAPNGQNYDRLDQRIKVSEAFDGTDDAGNSVSLIKIRYPGNVDIRFDITTLPEQTFDDLYTSLEDYKPVNVVNVMSDCTRAEADSGSLKKGNITSDRIVYQDMTTARTTTDAGNINALTGAIAVPLTAGETLHLMTWHGSNQVGRVQESTYDVSLDRAPNTVVTGFSTMTVLPENVSSISEGTDDSFRIDDGSLVWTAPISSLTSGTSTDSAADLTPLGSVYSVVSETNATASAIKTRQTQKVIPASNVYYDDELVNNGVEDYDAETVRLDWEGDAETGATASKNYWYKFRGTRIDVYCTTDANAGYVTASVGTLDDTGTFHASTDKDGNRKTIAMRSMSEAPRYNVPTISFDGLDADTDYYLRINALKGSNYQIDGIRVYHAANEEDAAVLSAYKDAGEQEANYVNLRAFLLNSVSEATLVDKNKEGAVFYTDNGTSYSLDSDEYQTLSPKNEIYLKSGEKVAFQIVGTYQNVAIGMSAPDTKTDGGSVRITNGASVKPLPITSALDSYYSVSPDPQGNVVIENNGNAMIAITNIKLSGTYTPPKIGMQSGAPLTVTKSLLTYAANFSNLPEEMEEPEDSVIPEETAMPEASSAPTEEIMPEPTATPTPSVTDIVRQLISSFVSRLFNSVSRLFAF